MFTIERFSVFEHANCEGLRNNIRVYLDGAQFTKVQVADSIRGVVKTLILDADGRPMLDKFRRAARTAESKGDVRIEVIDVAAYVTAQRRRLDRIEEQAKTPSPEGTDQLLGSPADPEPIL